MSVTLLDRPTIVDDATRRQFLTALAAAGLLTGCGANGATSAPATDGYPRTVTDEAGVAVEIPARPGRIAVTDPFSALEALLALGIAPIQVGVRSFADQYTGQRLGLWPWQRAAVDRLGGNPERVSLDPGGPDVEVVAGARPDLVVGDVDYFEPANHPLRALAPTVGVSFSFNSAVTLLGEALGLEDRAAEILADFESSIDAAVTGLITGSPRIAIIRPREDGTFFVALPEDQILRFLLRAGFKQVNEVANLPGTTGADVSLEQLGLLTGADVIVIAAFDPGPSDALEADPLFNRLPAAQAGRVIRLEQGFVAQAFVILSPLNLDTVLPFIRETAALAPTS